MRVMVIVVLLMVGTAALYAPIVRNGFVNFDDPDYITRNANVQRGVNWKSVEWAFGTENAAANWHPLTWISHMLDVSWFGMNPAGHHFTNVLLFTVDIVLLFLFLSSATGEMLRSAAVAALFAVHPLNVESVAWASERKATLSILFMLLTLWSYVWYARRPGAGRYVGVVVLYALALLSKTTVITLPFMLLLLDYWPLGRLEGTEAGEGAFAKRAGRLVAQKIPLFCMAGVVGWITFQIHRREGALTGAMPLAWRVKNSIYSYVAYLGKTAWPTRLAVFYPHPENRLSWWVVGLAALSLVVISGLVWRYRAKKYLVVGWLWYLGVLLPMIGLVQSGRQGMADRYVCVSLLGLFIGLVWLIGDWMERQEKSKAAVVAAFAVLLVAFGNLTRTQIGYWRNSVTLFGHALEVTQNNGVAEDNYGSALAEQGEIGPATQHLERATQLVPTLFTPHYDLAVILQRQGRWSEAEREYRLAIDRSADPVETAHAHNNLGALYLQGNHPVAAQAEFTKAIAFNPNEVNSYLGRGIAERQAANYDAAIADYLRVSELAPSAGIYFQLGQTYQEKGDTLRAQGAYMAALRLNPGMREAQIGLELLRTRTEAAQ